MANKQQTAVEWLSGKLVEILGDKCNELNVEQTLKNHYTFKQALQMERDQIVSAVHYGIRSPYTNIQTIHPQIEMTKGEQYYNDTYGTAKSR